MLTQNVSWNPIISLVGNRYLQKEYFTRIDILHAGTSVFGCWFQTSGSYKADRYLQKEYFTRIDILHAGNLSLALGFKPVGVTR